MKEGFRKIGLLLYVLPYPADQLSSAAQRSASSAERSAVRCRALPCCSLCCTYTSSCMPVMYDVSYHVPVLLISHQVCTYYIVGSQTMHPQLRSARLYIAQQRSAVRCRALPFVLRCCVVRRCALLRTYSSSTRYDTGTRYHYVPGICFILVFLLSSVVIVLSRSPCFPIPANTTCTAVQNVTSTSTQHSAGQVALRKHLNYQIAPNNHGPLLPAPLLHVSVAFFLARA